MHHRRLTDRWSDRKFQCYACGRQKFPSSACINPIMHRNLTMIYNTDTEISIKLLSGQIVNLVAR